ncbi:MAG: cysteine desulfurase [Thermoanaerobaculia bacterium]|nr:cysteine desulfurase [Thermoanaerobaculia bacterium]
MASPAELLATPAATALDLARLRDDFPILSTKVHGRQLVYLDNAATSQKPRQVLERMRVYYEQENSNVHRGVHELSERATAAFEGARSRVRAFVNAKEVREIVFTRGTTESINLVAQSWGHANVRAGDEIVISTIEHHSNIVPWQMLCAATGATLRVIPVNDRGELELDAYRELLSAKTKLVAIGHVSNALGTINPVREMIAMAHSAGALVLVDGAQAVPHLRVDVQALDADFYVFSGHKMYGPTGIGILYGKAALLEAMPPWMGGGDMISSVTLERSTWNVIPYKFEAGTPNIADAIGLAAAIDYLESAGIENVEAWEHELLAYATAKLSAVPGLRLVGTAANKAAVISFVLDSAHPHDIGTIVDQEGVAIRTGHHCAQPAMNRFGVPATARASFALYNTKDEVDALVRAIEHVVEIFG